MELLKSLLWGAIGIIAVAVCIGGVVILNDYLTYRSLQQRLRKEREVSE